MSRICDVHEHLLWQIGHSHSSIVSSATVWVTKKFPFFVKQRPCNGNFAFRFCARSVLHISVFIFAVWAKLFYAHGTVKKNGEKHVVCSVQPPIIAIRRSIAL